MKTKISFLMICMFAAVITLNAQGGGQPRTVEERVKTTMEKLAPLALDKDQTEKTNVVFTDYYKAVQKKRDEMTAGGAQPDRDKMREEVLKLNGERDEKLKKVFTADQFKKFKDEIEATLRPQRGGGGGGGNQ